MDTVINLIDLETRNEEEKLDLTYNEEPIANEEYLRQMIS